MLRNRFHAVALLAFGAMAPAAARAQTSALVQIEAAPQNRDPHPSVYIWEGANEPVKEPVQYYTYFYTGTVQPDASVDVGDTIQRIAIPNSDWEANKAAVIGFITSFYQEAFNVAPKAGSKVQFDENYNYVETETEGPPAFNPRVAAEWTFYYDQFVLWQYYCKRVVLNDKEAKKPNSSRDSLQRFRDAEALKGFEGVDVTKALKEVEDLRKFESGDKLAAPNAPAAIKAVTEFDPAADYADPSNNDIFYDEFMELGVKREKDSRQIYNDMLQRIDGRADESQRLKDWLDDKNNQLRDFARAWGDVKAGDSTFLGDTFVLITRKPLDAIPYGMLNQVVRDVITPQDLLTKDGRLKTASKD